MQEKNLYIPLTILLSTMVLELCKNDLFKERVRVTF